MLTHVSRRIKSAPQLCQFLAAVIPQDPPAAPGGTSVPSVDNRLARSQMALAAAPAPAGVLLGARKRKQQSLLEEVSALAGPALFAWLHAAR